MEGWVSYCSSGRECRQNGYIDRVNFIDFMSCLSDILLYQVINQDLEEEADTCLYLWGGRCPLILSIKSRRDTLCLFLAQS